MAEEEITIEEVVTDEKEDYKIKIAIIGDSGVGKTNLLKRFDSDTFSENSKATVGVEFKSKSYRINNKIFKIEFWDTAGQERYKSITAVYYKGAKGALLVYDITSAITFNNIDKWLAEMKEKTSSDIKLILIGNKTDLKESREVDVELGLDKAKTFGMPFMETSAKDTTNVQEAFHCLFKEIYKDYQQKVDKQEKESKEENEGIQLETKAKEEQSYGCCSKN